MFERLYCRQWLSRSASHYFAPASPECLIFRVMMGLIDALPVDDDLRAAAMMISGRRRLRDMA